MIYYGYEFIRESDLNHHGILGQKWGVRRFQNKDGTLTAAGRRRLKTAKQASEVALDASMRLTKEANDLREISSKSKEIYSGKDGWKKYAMDVYDTTDGREYGVDKTVFKNKMKSELAYLLAQDDANIKRYEDAAKKWLEVSKGWDRLTVNDLDKSKIRYAKIFITSYKMEPMSISHLLELVEEE